jgi:hypothetical protein
MALFGRSKVSLLRRFLELPGGIPSRDTFSRIFRLLDPRGWLPAPTSVVGAERSAFEACFARYLSALSERVAGVVAIDGKTARCAASPSTSCAPIAMTARPAARSNAPAGTTPSFSTSSLPPNAIALGSGPVPIDTPAVRS